MNRNSFVSFLFKGYFFAFIILWLINRNLQPKILATVFILSFPVGYIIFYLWNLIYPSDDFIASKRGEKKSDKRKYFLADANRRS